MKRLTVVPHQNFFPYVFLFVSETLAFFFSRLDSLRYVLICSHKSADKRTAKIVFVCVYLAPENLLVMKLNTGKIYLV